MKFLLFETTSSFTTKRPAPLLTAADASTTTSSNHSTASTSSTCSTAHEDEDDWFLEHEDDDEEDDDSLSGRRRVRFVDPNENEYYDNTILTRDEVRDLWYHKTDFQTFKRQTLDAAHDLLKQQQQQSRNDQYSSYYCYHHPQDTEPDAVIAALDTAFTGFCAVKTSADILTVLATCPIPHLSDPRYIGMDRYLVKSIVMDRTERKRRIQRQMTWWQSHRAGDDRLTQTLRQVCRLESQPCRLYAHHVAQCAMQSDHVMARTNTAADL